MAQGGIQGLLGDLGAVVRVEEIGLTTAEEAEYGGWKRLGMALGHFADAVAKSQREGYLTVGLLATCPSMPGLVAGLQRSGPPGKPLRVGMLWLDAHPDFNTPETTRSGSLGGMPVAVATGRALQRLRLDAKLDPPMADARIVMAGVRLTDPLEQELLDRSRIQQLGVDDLRRMTPAVFAQLDRLNRISDRLYIHIDLDVLDPREVMGHQNKVPNGPSSVELAALFEEIFRRYPKATAIGFATIPATDPEGLSLAAVNRMIAGAVRGARARAERSRPEEALAFTNVSVIDGTDSLPRRDQTVVVRGNRIEQVGPSGTVRAPAGARVVPAAGKFLIPGLWDMHVHTAVAGGRDLLGLYIANGVTGVRDMAGDWPTLRGWRDEIGRGTLVGPRILASGPYLEGGDIPIPHLLARTPEEGKAGVDSLVRLGVDFVKIHGRITREAYFAIAARARERGIPFAGHVPRLVGAADASEAGQRSIEHLLAIPAPCTPAESLALRPRFPVQGALGRCSSTDLAPLYAQLVRNNTWVTPTFVAQYEVASWPGRVVPGDSLAHYLPEALRRYVAEIFPMPDSIPPGADSAGRAMFAKRQAQVAAMRAAGVGILTGTDAPLRNSPPGFGLHEELLLLVQGGLRPWQAIRAATIEPARYFGMLDSAGTIAAGKLADLVLLDADPLRDIRHTRRIAAVMANGRFFGSVERRKLLAR
ncbi:MAG: amidohydrolase family protein [Gemmatimonadales bacterium]|nr:amidohydrolase family protein [Gemmatimonadales bacterium]